MKPSLNGVRSGEFEEKTGRYFHCVTNEDCVDGRANGMDFKCTRIDHTALEGFLSYALRNKVGFPSQQTNLSPNEAAEETQLCIVTGQKN